MNMEEADPIPVWDRADRMRKALRTSAMTVSEMADYLGVSRTSVSNWINGRVHPSLMTLRLWALRTGVSFQWLCDGTGGPPSGPGQNVFFRGSVNSGNMNLYLLAA